MNLVDRAMVIIRRRNGNETELNDNVDEKVNERNRRQTQTVLNEIEEIKRHTGEIA